MFEGLKTYYTNDGLVAVAMRFKEGENTFRTHTLGITRKDAFTMSMSLLRCIVKATCWKAFSKN